MSGGPPRDRLGRPLPAGSRDLLGRRDEPRDVGEARRRAIEAFDRHRFFEAHEDFEWIWKAAATPPGDREFWKGVTQIAVGCCHLQRGNPAGARALLARGLERLERYPSPHLGIDTRALIEGAQEVSVARRDDDEDSVPRFFRFPVAG